MSNRKGQVGFGFSVDGLYNAAAIGISDCIGVFLWEEEEGIGGETFPTDWRGDVRLISLSFLIIFLYTSGVVYTFSFARTSTSVYINISPQRVYTHIYLSLHSHNMYRKSSIRK